MAVSGSAAAQLGKPFEIEAELTVAPKYVWRGINIVNDWVIQPGVTVSRGGFSLGVWMNFEPTNWNLPNYNQAPRGRVTEMDVTLEYSKSIGVVEASVGVVDYQFPGTGGRRYQEFFGSVGLSYLWGSPELRVFTGERSGTYATVSVSHELPGTYFGQGGIELDASLSFGDARSNKLLLRITQDGIVGPRVDRIKVVRLWRSPKSHPRRTLCDPARPQPQRGATPPLEPVVLDQRRREVLGSREARCR